MPIRAARLRPAPGINWILSVPRGRIAAPLRPRDALRGPDHVRGDLGPPVPRPSRGAVQLRREHGPGADNRLTFWARRPSPAWYNCRRRAEAAGHRRATCCTWQTRTNDNGDIVRDGTPHMNRVFDAFNRHQMQCATPAREQRCAGGPPPLPPSPRPPRTRAPTSAGPRSRCCELRRVQTRASSAARSARSRSVRPQASPSRTPACRTGALLLLVMPIGSNASCFAAWPRAPRWSRRTARTWQPPVELTPTSRAANQRASWTLARRALVTIKRGEQRHGRPDQRPHRQRQPSASRAR